MCEEMYILYAHIESKLKEDSALLCALTSSA